MSQKSHISFLACAACGHRNSIVEYDAAKTYHCSACGGPLTGPPTEKALAIEFPSSVELDGAPSDAPYWSVAGAPAAPKPSPSSGDTLRLAPFGKYTLVREIGRGGMGFVYEALDTMLDRRVALKMLYSSPNADPKEAALDEERFLREARLSANLPKHTGIVSVYEAGVIDGRRYLAMEFIDGQPMSAWRKLGSVTMRQQVALLRDVAQAVHHAHEHGIVHRDLKPPNVLVDTRNQANVTDFGLAKTVGQSAAISLTASGMVVGTPSYMSPEQAQGLATVDRRTDVYAMGVMLYEILTGMLPYTGQSPVDILVKVIREPVVPPSTAVTRRPAGAPAGPAPSGLVHAVIDPAIEAVCMKALAREPECRYPTAQALAEDLTAWLKGETVGAAPFRPCRARSALRPAVVAGALLGLIASVAGWLWLGRSRPEPPRAAAAEPAVAPPVPTPAPPPPDPWRPFLADLKRALAVEAFDAKAAEALLARVATEFPDRRAEVDEVVDQQHRIVTAFLEGLSKDRWLEAQPRVRAYRAWLAAMKRPVEAADRILAYRGTCTITLHVHPWAEVRGPLVAPVAPEDRCTPLTLRDVEIADGEVELIHPVHGRRTVRLAGLEHRMSYVIEGDWSAPDGITLRGE
jgi:tRNA A-37 threonylcarbamoyl transferase component Bud32